MIPDSFITELKFRNDIEDVISPYVPLKRAGSNTVKGLCPFHSEKTPSFVVYKDTQSYYCFGCGAGGDVITFIRNIENLDYVEAVKWLAQRCGMQVPEQGVDDSMGKLKLRILEANRAAARFFYAVLKTPAGKPGLDYLRGRGLTDETIKHFGLGYAPDSWSSLRDALRQKGFSDSELLAADLVARSKKGGTYDKFRNRVIFPIIDVRGNVIAFGGRNLGDEKPKYLNTAETPVFHKNRNLFALGFAKNHKGEPFILAEGYMDVIAMHQAGFPTAVATLGTAIGESQARLIAQYTGEVIVSYDADEAGQVATKRAVGFLAQTGLKIRILTIPGAKDPDEFIKKNGAHRFQRLLDEAKGSTEHELSRIEGRYNLEDPEGRIAYLREAAQAIAALPTPGERDVYAGVAAEKSGVKKDNVLLQVEDIRRARHRKERKRERQELVNTVLDRRDTVNPQAAAHPRAATAEEMLIAIAVRDGQWARYIFAAVEEGDFVTDFDRRLYGLLKSCPLPEGPDLTYLTKFLTPEELARVSRMLAKSAGLKVGKEDVDFNIRNLKEESRKLTAERIAQTPETQLGDLIAGLKDKKK